MNKTAIRALGAAIVMAAGMWAGSASAACNDGSNRRMSIVNNSNMTVRELYGSRASTNSWEEDVLGSNVLGSGRSVNVNWDDNSCECIFDFKAVMANGREIVRNRVNVCTESRWLIN